jgi:putative ABC transport system permease protein
MREFLQDVRYGARVLTRQPGFTGVVALTLALAIGANTVIFSIASFLLLRPLPFRDHQTLAAVFAVDPQRGSDRELVSAPDFLEWRQQSTVFEQLGAFANETYTLTGRGEPVRLSALGVTANLFDVWRVEVTLGRGFHAGEDRPGAAPVVALSHGFWQRQMAGNPNVLGESLMLDGRAHTIVGVVTREMELGNMSLLDVWTPMVLDANGPRDARRLRVYGRLSVGASVDQASVEMATIAERQARDHPTTNEGWSAHAMPLLQSMTGNNTGLILTLLSLVVTLVLVIACANVANLMLARAVVRKKELAVRASLGAGRVRLVRQLVTESLLLGVLGGVLGLALAMGGLAIIKAVSFEPFFQQIEVDYRVLTFVAVLSLATPLLFSLLPAIHAARVNLNQALTEGAGRTSGGLKGRHSRNALVVAQLSLATMLLVLSTLIVRVAIAQARLDFGFNPENILTLQLELEGPRYPDDDAVGRFYEDALGRLARLPGVSNASTTSSLPVFDRLSPAPFAIEGRPVEPDLADRPWALDVTISPDYFSTFDIPLRHGRAFTTGDRASAQHVVIISTETAQRYWPDDDPLDRRIRLTDNERWLTIVGIVDDVFNRQELVEGFDPQLYLPAAQHPRRALAFAIRTTSEAADLAPLVRGELRKGDPNQAVYDVKTMAQVFRDQLASDRVIFGMFISFAVVALILASAGLYGLMSYSVAQRTQEFGVRLALGAQGRDVVLQVVRHALKLVAIGLVLGLLGGLGLAHAIASLLFGVEPSDPTIYGGVAAVLVIVAVVASYLPARRALALGPVRALRP